MKISKSLKIAAAALALSFFAVTPASAVGLTGAGATFPAPLFDNCKAGFAEATGHTFTYGLGGSGTGRGNSDKGVGDVNFTDTAHKAATRVATVIHVPVVAAPIAVLYNLPNKSKTLNLSANTLAGIFAGTITKWNDPAIVADNNRQVKTVIYRKNADGTVKRDAKGNPEVLRTDIRTVYYTLPNQAIKVVYRSDASGTQGNFTNFLNGAAPSIWTKAGNNAFSSTFPGDLNAPANLGRITGASGSSGVSVQAGKTPYSITFAEASYAKAQRLGMANIQNAAGNFQAPDAAGTSAFLAAGTVDANGFIDFNYKTTNPGAYPLGIVSYALVDTKNPNAAAIKQLLNYLLSAKCVATSPDFALIGGELLAINQKQIAKIGA
ncbi:MAG: extracellular solute-binding protein [Micrococcales bacterium]|nr:extracellular solute-binding protein [Microbacteriaceae bacterium]NBR24102.1 extracellular solute-binding protein [Micrococcales bacterium]NBS62365.1 extracellular solute-binding protein [Microbacteriaceae bacterium]